MAKWVLVVETNCIDKTREAEFNEWYNKTHLPDMLETPGLIRVTRYEAIDPSGGAKFLATYEIETEDIDAFMKRHNANVERKRAQGRFSNLMKLESRRVFKQISSVSK